MADPATYRPASGSIPIEPGVYRFRDPHGRVIYVGKAKNLRSRLGSYFADPASLHPRTQQMVLSAAGVDWTVVGTEVEALQLEYNWIKEFDPRFNVRYRDDKSYPMLAVSVSEEFPRLFVYRGPRRRGVRYFGPYSHAWAIRETLDLLLRVFPARTCSAGVFKRHQQLGRPCLLGYIDKCSAPCVGRVSAAEHREIVDGFCDFLAGRTDKLMRQVEKQMTDAAEELDFERAARLRDDLAALRTALEKQSVVLGDGTDADVIGVEADDLEVAVQVFHVRGGRVRGRRGWVVERADNATEAELVGQFLTQFYGGETEHAVDAARRDRDGDTVEAAHTAVPREVLVPTLPPDDEEVARWLSGLRGSKVRLRVPQRGDKKDLAATVHRNAVEALTLHKLKRAGDLTTRSQALQGIQEALDLDQAPLRIECVDISHLQGTDVVASLVVFEDGLPRKSDYRHYAIQEAAGGGHSDDVASIAEVTRRRFRRHRADADTAVADADTAADPATDPATDSPAEPAPVPADGGPAELAPEAGIDPQTGRPRRFAYPPNLFLVDGGPAQVAAAAAELDDLGITDVAVAGLAKRLEEVWLPDDDEPVILPRSSEALYLLQRIRDEAHRFAITFHRSKRSRRMTASVLDGIPGLGEVRRATLVEHFGSPARLRQASVEEITAVPGIGPTTAAAIVTALAEDPAAPVADTDPATGSDESADTAAAPAAAGPDTDS